MFDICISSTKGACQKAICHPYLPVCRTLEVLQDQVTPQPFDEINGVLQREFQADASELFAEFEETATAAASLAQVM